MTTVAAIPIPMSPIDDRRHTPMLSTIDSAFSPASLHLQPYTRPSGGSPTSSHSSGSATTPHGSPRPQTPPGAVPMGSRFQKVPYEGPGTAVYVRQPTRAQLRENNSVFGSAHRPYYYKDPDNKPFLDVDGKECGDRWVYVDPKGRAEGDDGLRRDDKAGCCIM
ncbi:hypothetical protein JCM10207_008011 [Rhodosporidiobolus poonsookiae]